MKPDGTSGVPTPKRVHEILPEHLPDGLLSIAVFGPGEGEAIVVRLPDGLVGVVDGCREPEKGHPDGRGDPVRELLAKMACALPDCYSFRIGFVCLTHPHMDHYRGLGRLIEAYEGRIEHLWTVTHATPQYEQALPEWLELIREGKAPDEEDLNGLRRVLSRFHDEKTRVEISNPNGYAHLSQRKNLLKQIALGHSLTIDACGPADGDLHNAQMQLLNIIDAAARGESVSRNHDPNLTSGALLIRWGSAAVLLAGDLVKGKASHSGWQRAASQIDCQVQVVNVAHHASEEAHDDALWARISPALAIVTPFKHGKRPNPPRPDQVAALARASVVAITSPPAWEHEPDPPKGLYGARGPAAAIAKSPLAITPKPGHEARRNAVAVSLDATGTIKQFVLAGQADVYDV